MAINYQVKQGDCISSIASNHGFLPDTIWDHPNNADLKARRKDLNTLNPGDVVYIPDLRVKEVSESTNQVHKFVCNLAPAKLNLHLLNDGEPISNQSYTLKIDGKVIEGMTDGEGKIRASIKPTAEKASLIVGEGQSQIIYDLHLGTLPPIEEISGVKRRLHNLGYKVGSLDDSLTEDLEEAIAEFEFDNELEQTGKISATNRVKLKEVYGL
jgi:hypothetical protein